MLLKNIKNIMSPFLKQYGYCYKASNLQGVYQYEKEEEGVTKYIVVDKVRIGNTIRLLFRTSLMAPMRDYQLYLIDEKFNNKYFWNYNSESELQDILKEFCEHIKKYGLETLEILSKKYLKPDKSMFDALSEETKSKSESFARRFDLVFENPKEQLGKLIKIIEAEKAKSSEPSSNFIIDAAAYYGELIINNLGGSWQLDNYKGEDYIVSRVGGKNIDVSPIDDINAYWFKGTLYCHELKVVYESIESTVRNPEMQ
ncbi:hypothetical protein [Clostridium folliculivorans]|uniref:Uncharacterized protein n=1 Tax=Clostridium folliculivorans TaxID=2886038 RepID=A0A9W6DAC4_9CLOT|nr:hypothetical protein [Clostridium folliculivorans]GKU25230.1 hypothetical protein CFOLD11_20560 [Clostridium folliculivorans]GKU31328.1 hypothetical protein CFB3_34350 [Clostridium folliculivorans]